MFYLSMMIAIISVIFYQILQKSISSNVNPADSLIITYSIALIFSVFLLFVFPQEGSFMDSVKKANISSYLLGFAVVGIEVAFLLIYRSGWKIGIASPLSSSVTNVVLISVGLLIFREHLTGTKILGLLFCIIGIVLISLKK